MDVTHLVLDDIYDQIIFMISDSHIIRARTSLSPIAVCC